MTEQPSTELANALSSRPLSIRLTEAVRAQLELLAQLNERSTTEEVRVALENWIESSKSDAHVIARGDAVRAQIAEEARLRAGAIDAIFAPPSKARSAVVGEKS